ncbi:uncharacterized protein LOC126606319 isoform X1 [Malus sylvestris]|uniref:uncharacterized protein LOC126606319 isoform X1 n=1 Tax=Malus sylvestris TaxID=3752 RepID=UPI0021ACC902|nr:uncharacterized protein LOC126606319 isoform X1 [Malus sylvestris]
MASASTFVFALLAIFSIVVAIRPVTADPLDNLLAPIFSPILDDVCKEVECGKGNCKPSSNSTFFFECDCEPGWKQTSNNTHHFKFLPCVIPNCNLDFSCTKAPAPVSDQASKANESSIFDPCFWAYCGGGSCNKTSKFTYNCKCDEGYDNLLNVTTLPCLEECAIGMTCANLGISMSNKSTASPPALSDNGKNQGSSMVQVNSAALVILMMFAAMVHWK